MAMNKKEQAEMAALKRKLAVASAFVRTPAVAKDLPPPDPVGRTEYTHGFDFNTYDKSTREYWSGCIFHYTSNPAGKKGYLSGSQRGIALYSTRLLALKALRHAVENETAESLANIDMKIAAEIQAQQEGK
jgi:hypothetical protein